MMKKSWIFILTGFVMILACGRGGTVSDPPQEDSVAVVRDTVVPLAVVLEKRLLYDRYTLEDRYPYRDTFRVFQWEKIRERLRLVDSVQRTASVWGVLQNRNNINGEAPLTRQWVRNDFKRVSDLYGTERRQSIPLYPEGDSIPERYGEDGSLVKLIAYNDDSTMMRVEVLYIGGTWGVPTKYVKLLADTVVGFRRMAVVDRTNQNICTVEKADTQPVGQSVWFVRSMNPATTGLHKPPYQMETPLGIFVLQEKKSKMLYTHDGSSVLAGYAPWANRFSNGGYVHGVPTNDVNGPMIEFSRTLGTTPRSHKCIRNTTSHAKFFYDWAPTLASLIIVIE